MGFLSYFLRISYIWTFKDLFFILGFSLTGDMHMIRHALPHLNFTTKQVGFLDLCSFWKILEKHPEVKLPFEGIYSLFYI